MLIPCKSGPGWFIYVCHTGTIELANGAKTLILQTVKEGFIVWPIKYAQTVRTKPVSPAFIQFFPSVVNFPEP